MRAARKPVRGSGLAFGINPQDIAMIVALRALNERASHSPTPLASA